MTPYRFSILSILSTALLSLIASPPAAAQPAESNPPSDYLIPNESLMTPFKDRVPIIFVTRNQPEWQNLKAFWNEASEEAIDPSTGVKVTRKAVKIKVPLGLTTPPVVPAENPMTVEKWILGKKLYYDPILSTDATVSCASCHNPKKGFSDGSRTSTGIGGKVGLVNSPTVFNAAYSKLQFWDGRAISLEEQAQGPVGSPSEMFAGKGDPWTEAVARLRANPEYVKMFQAVFGHLPTRDAAAKAIATYERTVLLGNSLVDRAEAIMRQRVIDEESGKFELKAEDFVRAIKDEFARKGPALKDLGLDPDKDGDKAEELGRRLLNGRTLFFNKARCSNCHTGDTYSDGGFHNIGIGVGPDGELPPSERGRFGSLALGHKDPSLYGAFKTPGTRGLLQTAPYMHTGEEKTLEDVVEYYDRGGNANRFLSEKMRDTAAEAAYTRALAEGKPVDPTVKTFGPTRQPIIPLKLNLTAQEKADLVLFLKALNGDPLDPLITDPDKFPTR
jgi:cytochrome c peroxidase